MVMRPGQTARKIRTGSVQTSCKAETRARWLSLPASQVMPRRVKMWTTVWGMVRRLALKVLKPMERSVSVR